MITTEYLDTNALIEEHLTPLRQASTHKIGADDVAPMEEAFETFAKYVTNSFTIVLAFIYPNIFSVLNVCTSFNQHESIYEDQTFHFVRSCNMKHYIASKMATTIIQLKVGYKRLYVATDQQF